MERNQNIVLSVKNLKTHFIHRKSVIRAVDGIDFDVKKGDTVGIVGESGCGKSVTALSLMRLIPMPPAAIEGKINLNGPDILKLREKEIRKIRGAQISMIFQEPMVSLNPVFTIRQQLKGVIKLHQNVSSKDLEKKACSMLQRVGIPEPSKRLGNYPHQLSGGMRQRIMIAMAISSNPKLLIADEPTTSLDVTIQAQVIDLLAKLKEESNLSIIFITHDLNLISEIAQEIYVMYAGQIVEQAPVKLLFESPLHPYTQALFASTPRFGQRDQRLKTIPGTVPQLIANENKCRFGPRCPDIYDKCSKEEPILSNIGENRNVRCWKYDR